MSTVKAYGNQSATAPLGALTIERRALNADDVSIEILYCGVCHSDIHTARSEWGPAKYPVVPGHEIIGKVIAVGDGVNRFKTGDVVGVGCIGRFLPALRLPARKTWNSTAKTGLPALTAV
jgi:Zn-dependent alcohol dehydrogenases